jgi:hypothetical protein
MSPPSYSLEFDDHCHHGSFNPNNMFSLILAERVGGVDGRSRAEVHININALYTVSAIRRGLLVYGSVADYRMLSEMPPGGFEAVMMRC